MAEFSILAVFLTGLLGGVHCAGMCGSIVGVFTSGISTLVRPSANKSMHGMTANNSALPSSWGKVSFHLAYNGGRLASYAVAGALAGTVGQAGLLMRDAVPVQHLLFALSSLMLVALGLYLAGIWSAVRRIEHLGGRLWKQLQPYTAKLLPVNTLPRALGLGLLWGWLPCGLVYSVLVASLASGDATQGALVMLAFGLGTLPNLLAIGLFWENIRKWLHSRIVQLAAGLLVAGLGVYGLIKVGYTFYIYGWSGSCHVPA